MLNSNEVLALPLSSSRIFLPLQLYQHKFQEREFDPVEFHLFLKFPRPIHFHKNIITNVNQEKIINVELMSKHIDIYSSNI